MSLLALDRFILNFLRKERKYTFFISIIYKQLSKCCVEFYFFIFTRILNATFFDLGSGKLVGKSSVAIQTSSFLRSVEFCMEGLYSMPLRPGFVGTPASLGNWQLYQVTL